MWYQQFTKQTLILLKKNQKFRNKVRLAKKWFLLTTNIKFKIYTNISYNVATYETPWQAEFWKQVLFIGRLRVDKKGKKKKKTTSAAARLMHTPLNPICSFLNTCSTAL